jgi:hypothetical protein
MRRPLPTPNDDVLLGPTHELLAIWARLPEESEKRAKLLHYAWTLLPEKRRGEVRQMLEPEPGDSTLLGTQYNANRYNTQANIERRTRKGHPAP